MISWVNVAVLALSTLLFLYFYVRSAGPATLEAKIGARAYPLCTRYRFVASAFMGVATVNYVIYFFYPLPVPVPATFPWPWWVSALIALAIAVPSAYLFIRGVKDAGGNVMVVNRSVPNGEQLAGDLSATFVPLQKIGELTADILINTTPVGMHPHTDEMPVPAGIFRRGGVVMDIVYTPLKTEFLKQARAAGGKTIDGVTMFVKQGARQFELWTGLEAPVDVMRKAVMEQLPK